MKKQDPKNLEKNRSNKLVNKLLPVLDKIEYGLIAIAATVISFYIFIIALSLLSKRYQWMNVTSISWILISVAAIISISIGIFIWRKVGKGAKWTALKVNILMYHLNNIGQNMLFWFIWMVAVLICLKTIPYFSNNNTIFNQFLSSSIFKSINTILTSILGVLSIFNLGKISVYKLDINWNISYDKNNKKINIWATNVGSASVAYRLLGLYDVKAIDDIYNEKENWVLVKDLEKIKALYREENNINFENLSVGYSTRVSSIFLYDIKGIDRINEFYIIYESSLGKIEIKKISLENIRNDCQ